MNAYVSGTGGLTDDQLCHDRPCTCGAAIHDPVKLAATAKVFLAALARRPAGEAKPGA